MVLAFATLSSLKRPQTSMLQPCAKTCTNRTHLGHGCNICVHSLLKLPISPEPFCSTEAAEKSRFLGFWASRLEGPAPCTPQSPIRPTQVRLSSERGSAQALSKPGSRRPISPSLPAQTPGSGCRRGLLEFDGPPFSIRTEPRREGLFQKSKTPMCKLRLRYGQR